MEGARDRDEGRTDTTPTAHHAADGCLEGGATPEGGSRPLRPAWRIADPEGGAGHDATGCTEGAGEARRAHPAAYLLFASGHERSPGQSDSGPGRTPGPGDHAAVHAPQSSRARC